jgi:hypothetical protein
MAKKTVLVSDMSGEEIPDGKGATVRITFRMQERASGNSTSPIPDSRSVPGEIRRTGWLSSTSSSRKTGPADPGTFRTSKR